MNVHFLSDEQKELFTQYQQTHSPLFINWIIRHFFETPEHVLLLCLFLQTNDQESKDCLEEAFRRFFFAIRFSKYVRSTIRYQAVVQDRRRQRYQDKHHMILDKAIGEDGESTLGDHVLAETREAYSWTGSPERFRSAVDNELLFEALGELTQKQLLVTTLAYSQLYKDTEIAETLRISQQAVYKTRSAALNKLSKFMYKRSTPNVKEAT
ncbi:hypothetical protein J31TS4_38320 [Paenibacillus sp. J31TS4]|uniref:hypothetical protein n=1 Tax=Paenibacillus sp. J31TS4 TaxID=2807195 RepID=UPI001B22737A|nr:hypothetical protein [Paenibacillus sp. J31TS4]GIP40552.1 hypothetical protein J31TS4_38320 [Paenibacillus sp. J31TS4]